MATDEIIKSDPIGDKATVYILRGLYLLYSTFNIVSDHMLKVLKTLSAYCLRFAQGRKRKLGIKVGEKRFVKSFGLDYPLLSTNC